MNKPGIIQFKPVRDQVDEAEWKMRVDLAACYRLMARYGMSDMIYNHITARVPGSPDHILINAYGLMYPEITASSLYKIDLAGNVVLRPDTQYGINNAGYLIHSTVHQGRPDIHCVLHNHARASTAVSAMKSGLLPLTQTAMRFYDRVSYHDYQAVALFDEERPVLLRDLGPINKVMVLRNHGMLYCGTSIADAFNIAYFFENACRIQIDVMQAGAEPYYPPREVMLRTRDIFENGPNGPGTAMSGELEWPALLRMLDRDEPSYKE